MCLGFKLSSKPKLNDNLIILKVAQMSFLISMGREEPTIWLLELEISIQCWASHIIIWSILSLSQGDLNTHNFTQIQAILVLSLSLRMSKPSNKVSNFSFFQKCSSFVEAKRVWRDKVFVTQEFFACHVTCFL